MNMLQFQLLSIPVSFKDSEQVVHTHVPLSPCCIIWYWPKGGDAVWMGR